MIYFQFSITLKDIFAGGLSVRRHFTANILNILHIEETLPCEGQKEADRRLPMLETEALPACALGWGRLR